MLKILRPGRLPVKDICKVKNPISQEAVKLAKQLEKDVFQKEDLTSLPLKELAKTFRTSLVAPYADWQDAIPADSEAGSELIKKAMKKFRPSIEKLNPDESERFLRLVFGENHLGALEKSRKTNTDIRLFAELFESKIGKPIEKVIVGN